jgi:putative heme-binding domain-containing protein
VAAVVAQQLASDPQGAELLLRAIEEGKASARLLLDVNVTQRLTTVNDNDTDRRIVRLTAGLPPPDESLRKQTNDLDSRFARARPNQMNGGKVFEQHCANCHELKGKGGKVGPQLDGAAARGLERLLEDLLDPSHAVEKRYRATMLTLSDGRLVTGLIVREEQGTIVLVDAEGKETSIPTTAVQARRATTLSPMPADLVARIGDKHLLDLLAFLLDAAKK